MASAFTLLPGQSVEIVGQGNVTVTGVGKFGEQDSVELVVDGAEVKMSHEPLSDAHAVHVVEQ